MNKPTSAICDVHTIVDLGGERRASTIAVDLAARLNAHLTGVTLAFEPLVASYTMAAPVPTDFIVAARERSLADAKVASAAFEKAAKAGSISFEAQVVESVIGEGLTSAVRDLRLTDLVVVGQENPDRVEPMRGALIEAILFEAAAPALVIPYVGVKEFKTGRVVVAWDRSAPAARAVRAAMPLLQLSEEVLVVIVEESRKWSSGVPGTNIGAHLARHGLNVEVRRIDNAVGDVAASIFNFAANESADWMVMGAYGHSRMRELLLGGVTRKTFGSMTLPVLMVH